jgi:hypothetical protein
MADAKNYISWILSSFSDYLAAPVLEIGVGHGSYASVLRGHSDFISVDIDPASVEGTAAVSRSRFSRCGSQAPALWCSPTNA